MAQVKIFPVVQSFPDELILNSLFSVRLTSMDEGGIIGALNFTDVTFLRTSSGKQAEKS